MRMTPVRALIVCGCLIPALTPVAHGDRPRMEDRNASYAGAYQYGSWRRLGRVSNTCAGTSQGFTTGKNATSIYMDYRYMYTNCSFVLGNLEIVMPPDDPSEFDFGFLSNIQEVKGYVLVHTTRMVVLPLYNLTIIRGEQLLSYLLSNEQNVMTTYQNLSLIVTFNARLKHLELTSLKEISNGNVALLKNSALSCHTYSSVDWRYIFSLNSQMLYTVAMKNQVLSCSSEDTCHTSCQSQPAGEKHCWGPSADQCQQVIRCSPECQAGRGGSGPSRNEQRQARCYGTQPHECCHSECAGSCTGPYDYKCLACRNFRIDDRSWNRPRESRCVASCPDLKIYDPKTYTFLDNPEKRYALGAFCVRSCPDNYAVFNKGCVITCPSGYTVSSGSVCEACVGACPKDCPVNFDLDTSVTSANIMSLANCTQITGNLLFSSDAFQDTTRRRKAADDGETIERERPLTAQDLAILSTVKRVTGYVVFESSAKWLTNMEFLSALEEIGGTSTVYNSRFSLLVRATHMTHLGLKSLRRISGGNVYIKIKDSCYTDRAAFQSIIRDRVSATVQGQCNASLCDSQCKTQQCWGPGPSMCMQCANFASADGRTCITSCRTRSGEYEPPGTSAGQGAKCGLCHSECHPEDGCSGPTEGNCTSCRNYRDGPYCRSACPQQKYADADKQCQLCHPYCRDGCSGSSTKVGRGGCLNCHVALVKNVGSMSQSISQCMENKTNSCPLGYFSSESLKKTPTPEHKDTREFCIPCDAQCESCLFYEPINCLTCKNVEIGTSDQEGTVSCAEKCQPLHYVELQPPRQGSNRPRRVCVRCHEQCLKSCQGPGPSQCEQCSGKRLYNNATASHSFTCVDKCPPEMSFIVKDDHEQDMCTHLDPAVAARALAEKKNIPGIIGGVIGGFVVVLGTALAIACVCRQRAASREKSRRYEAKLQGVTVSMESLNLTDAPPDLARLRLIKESEIRKGNVIGAGAFGTVYKGVWMPEGEGVTLPVAIKVLQEGTSPEQNKELLEEARIMATVMHPCCVRLIAVCFTSPMMLLTGLMPNGCLLDYVRKNKANIGSKVLLDWSSQIARGMEYLESRGIVHRDLAARNVLVQNTSQVKITDFGLAKVLEYNADQYEATGGKMPIKWMALESITNRIFTHKTDVWSYGVTVWELFTYGQRPYEGVRAYDMPQLLERGERLSQPTICTIDIYMIMIKCWMLDADSRPSFSDLATDFSRMSKDPGRYLVIAGDRLMKLASVSFTARDLLDDDNELASVAAEQGSKVMDLDEYLQPVTVASTTSDGSGTSALEHALTVKSLPAYPVNKGDGDAAKMRSADSRYGPAPARLAAAEEVDESTERQPFLPPVDEAGYLQPQKSASVEDYLNPTPAPDPYLDIIPEDDLGASREPDISTRSKSAAGCSHSSLASSVHGSAGKTADNDGGGSTNIDNPEYYVSKGNASLSKQVTEASAMPLNELL